MAKSPVLTASAGRKLLRRIRTLEDMIHALQAVVKALDDESDEDL